MFPGRLKCAGIIIIPSFIDYFVVNEAVHLNSQFNILSIVQ